MVVRVGRGCGYYCIRLGAEHYDDDHFSLTPRITIEDIICCPDDFVHGR
jgi:hypothetical protein